MANETESFTGRIVGVVISVVVVAAIAVPILNSMVGKDVAASGTPGTEGYVPAKTYPIQDGTMLATLVQIIPVFLILAVIMIVVGMFLSKRY